MSRSLSRLNQQISSVYINVREKRERLEKKLKIKIKFANWKKENKLEPSTYHIWFFLDRQTILRYIHRSNLTCKQLVDLIDKYVLRKGRMYT